MSERHVIITGAASGIGAALTRALAADGYRLHVCARRLDRLQEVTEGGRLARYHACDVGDEAQVTALFAAITEETGRLHGVITCAGGFGAIGPMAETDSQEWWETLRTNVFGTYLTIKHASPLLAAGSRIINFSGGGAFSTFPNYSAYAVSKSAVVRMTETLSEEMAGRGIAVNAVAPGFVLTEIHDATLKVGPGKAGGAHFQQTMAKRDGGAVPMTVPVNLVRWLLSDRAAGLTGKTISASFDPWGSPAMENAVAEINASDLYTMRRINLVNIEDGELRQTLTAARRPQ